MGRLGEHMCESAKLDVRKTVLSIHRSRAKYIWEKKTNKLPVHPYKPVSWLPTHQANIHINNINDDCMAFLYF